MTTPTIPIAEKILKLWPGGYTDEQVNAFLRGVEKLQPEAVLTALDEHYVEGRHKPKPAEIIQRVINGGPSRSEEAIAADHRAKQASEAAHAAAQAWAATVEDWDLEALRESMIAAKRIGAGVAAMYRNGSVRNKRMLLRMVYEYANETGVVR